jgi:hypothetical protein
LVHEKEQLPVVKPAAQVPEVPPLFVRLTSQLPFSVAAGHWAAQVSVTWVQVPLLHEKEQLPVYPTAQVPGSVLPLFVVVRTQLFSVSAGHWAAQVSVTWVQVPLLHAKEQLPVYPKAQVPVSVLPLFVVVRTQLFCVSAGHWAAQVSVTWVQVPLLHEKEQFPVYPAAQVPEVPPLLVALTSQSPFSVVAAQGAGAVHMPEVHRFELQSPFAMQFLPFPQVGQTPPPQSTSVSEPSRMPSAQVAGAHTVVEVLHTVLMQSLLARQCLPSAHAVHQAPPQSVSVSSQFFTPSKQVAQGAAPVTS